MAALRHTIIGTAGHVDHGKSSLIKALTGTDPDRLKEEKERGITIDLGFAALRLPGGTNAGIVDVPGHERFIHNMLAGIGGIDLVLLVVDVQEGVMPQTVEHLQILQLLEVRRGVVVLTKCDLADEDWIDIVEEEIRERVAGTFLANAPFCRVSVVTGAGLPALLTTIDEVLKTVPPKDADGPMRLPIDRHFTLAGFGTVVTGTLVSGRVAPGDTLELIPPGEPVRVREVQVHSRKVERAEAGQRVALNLAGVDRERLKRGAVLGTPGFFEQTECLDVRLTLLPEAPRPLKFRDPVHFFLGTARAVGLVAMLDRDTLQPGESALVQVHLDRPLMAHRGDRFIVRSYSPMTTIGGGSVVDPKPARHRRFRDEVMRALKELESGEKAFLLQKLAEKGAQALRSLELLSGLGRERVEDNLRLLAEEGRALCLADQWAAAETVRSWQRRLGDAVERYHQDNPLAPGIPRATLKATLPDSLTGRAFDRLLQLTVEGGDLEDRGEWVCRSGWTPQPNPQQARLIKLLEDAYRQEGTLAKNRNEMLERLGLSAAESDPCFTYLFGSGRLVKLNEENFLHREAYDFALAQLRAHFAAQPTITLAQFRDLIGSARKQTQALLEHYDVLKITQRRGDERVGWKL